MNESTGEATDAYPLDATGSFDPTPDAALPTITAHALADPDLALPPSSDHPEIAGYRILRPVSGGGMGTVYKALDLTLNRIIALKLINTNLTGRPDFRQRFEREAKTLAALDHPNIVPVYGAGHCRGQLYLTMKFIAGKTLYHHLEELGRDPAACARLMVLVARAVQYLHSNRIIHRDLKPLNILMTPSGVPLVADFGLVRPADDSSDLSQTIIPLGTRQYMSPEQTYGGRENYTFACDIWALGVILYELLAGTRPFGHDDPAELTRQVRNDPPPAIPAERNAPAALEEIARKCLAKAPADRYTSAEEVAADLECWLAGEHREPPPALTNSRQSRRVTSVLLGVGLIAVLAILIAGAAGAFDDPASDPDKPGHTHLQPVVTVAPTVTPSIAEQLQAGKTVWLVREKGGLLVPTRTLPGTHGAATTEMDGYLTLSSGGNFALAFETGPLPPTVTLEADVALVLTTERWSWGGVFGAVKETPHELGKQLSAIQLIQQNDIVEQGNKEILTEKAALELFRWSEQGKSDRTDSGSRSRTTNVPADQKQKLNWHRFSLALESGKVTGTWRDETVGSFSEARTLKLLNQSFGVAHSGTPPPFHSPAFGPGAGLCINNATVVFRNVCLVPSKP